MPWRALLKLARDAWPPAIAWVRFAMRGSVAAGLWTMGLSTAAQIVFVYALLVLAGSVEVQVAKAVVAVVKPK